MSFDDKLLTKIAAVEKGGAEKYHAKNREAGKLFARERIRLLLDEGSFVEDAKLANNLDPELPSDGVVIGLGRIDGRTVAVMANDSTIKAGSWGARTVEKILRIQETAAGLRCPLFYLVDSAGARITDQVEMFPGRRGAGRIFYNEVHLSGQVPQVCLLFGPSAAGGAYIPAFCDIVVMVDGNASMYLGSPRMAEMVIGEKVTLEEMGGAKMHCSVSGCGDILVKTEQEAIAVAKAYLSYLPSNFSQTPPRAEPRPPKKSGKRIDEIIPADQNKPFDMHELINELIDEGSWFEIKKLFAQELVTGFGAHRRAAGGDRRQPAQVQGRGALRGLGGQGGALHLAVRRVQHPAAVPGGRARLHDRHQGGARRHHPGGREDDLRRVRGERAEDLAWWCARPTAPGCTP